MDSSTAALIANNPELQAALSQHLHRLVGSSSGYVESLPKSVRRRVNALRNIQEKHNDIQRQYLEKLYGLEKEYAELAKPLYKSRKDIITGDYEPTEEECIWEEEEDELVMQLKDGAKITEEKDDGDADDGDHAHDEDDNADDDNDGADIKGIPSYWLTAMKSNDVIQENIHDDDEEALDFLTDIIVEYLEPYASEDEDNEGELRGHGFRLKFFFSENPFFSNTVLTKTYYTEPDVRSNGFSYEKAEGCSIDWKEGKNLSVRVIKKKQRHKGRGTTRTVTKTEKTSTFFNFFSPPSFPDDVDIDEIDEDERVALELDYEMGDSFKEKLVPCSVGWFTGEEAYDGLDEDEEDDEDDDEDDNGDDDGDDDDDEDADYDPSKDKTDRPPECKQQ